MHVLTYKNCAMQTPAWSTDKSQGDLHLPAPAWCPGEYTYETGDGGS